MACELRDSTLIVSNGKEEDSLLFLDETLNRKSTFTFPRLKISFQLVNVVSQPKSRRLQDKNLIFFNKHTSADPFSLFEVKSRKSKFQREPVVLVILKFILPWSICLVAEIHQIVSVSY